MKNIIFAVAGLAVVITAIFIFSSHYKFGGDTLIPSPVPVESPKINLQMPNSTKSADLAPFPILSKEELQGKKIKLDTVKGDVTIELFADTPLASSNFLHLVNKKFYDGLTFHRVEKGFVVQGGDPNGNGTGGPGYSFVDEPVNSDYLRGVVAMANAGPNTNGSQFFIALNNLSNLPKSYTIFGKVLDGMNVVDQIAVGDKMVKVVVE